MTAEGAVIIESSDRAIPAQSSGGSLPAPVSSFIGRERELAELETLVDEARLVTLTGTGGSGKTRLALELARRLERRLAEFFFVDLAPITDPGLIASTIAAVLRIRAKPGTPLIDTLAERLREQRILLVLDNLEQLPGAAAVIADLLARCPNLRVLATSRVLLHLSGEQAYTVDPLALPEAVDLASPERLARTEAVALFVERARSIDARFALSSQNAGAITEICRRLDGLPLAIELAAARSRLLAPDALLRRLEHRLPLLTAGAADAPARQRTLRDTIAWSYDLLEPPDRLLFARISIFVGGFALPAAEAVLDDPDAAEADLLEALGRLVEHNLLRVAPDAENEPRFSLLETIREFAQQLLPAAEAEELRERHAVYFTALAEAATRQVSAAEHGSSRRRVVDDDLDNLRAALVWAHDRNKVELFLRLAVALRPLFTEVRETGLPLLADHREAAHWIHAAEAMAANAAPPLRADVLFEVASYEMEHAGDRRRAERLFSECLRIYEALDNKAGIALTLTFLANVAADLGDRAIATRRLEHALSVARTLGDPFAAAPVLGFIAQSGPGIVDLDASRAIAEEAIDLGRQTGHRWTIASGLAVHGTVALANGDAAAAVTALAETDRIWAELGTGQRSGHPGTARLWAGDAEGARALIRDDVARGRDLGVVYLGLGALESAADWLGAMGRPHVATTCWAAADAVHATTRDRTTDSNIGLFASSRDRDRSALRPADHEAARASGQTMTLDEALDFAIRALDETDVHRPAASSSRGRYDLTPREEEVLELLASGRSDGEIGETLFISKKTAAVHVANIKGKLGAGSRVEIVTTAQRQGLVQNSP